MQSYMYNSSGYSVSNYSCTVSEAMMNFLPPWYCSSDYPAKDIFGPVITAVAPMACMSKVQNSIFGDTSAMQKHNILSWSSLNPEAPPWVPGCSLVTSQQGTIVTSRLSVSVFEEGVSTLQQNKISRETPINCKHKREGDPDTKTSNTPVISYSKPTQQRTMDSPKETERKSPLHSICKTILDQFLPCSNNVRQKKETSSDKSMEDLSVEKVQDDCSTEQTGQVQITLKPSYADVVKTSVYSGKKNASVGSNSCSNIDLPSHHNGSNKISENQTCLVNNNRETSLPKKTDVQAHTEVSTSDAISSTTNKNASSHTENPSKKSNVIYDDYSTNDSVHVPNKIHLPQNKVVRETELPSNSTLKETDVTKETSCSTQKRGDSDDVKCAIISGSGKEMDILLPNKNGLLAVGSSLMETIDIVSDALVEALDFTETIKETTDCLRTRVRYISESSVDSTSSDSIIFQDSDFDEICNDLSRITSADDSKSMVCAGLVFISCDSDGESESDSEEDEEDKQERIRILEANERWQSFTSTIPVKQTTTKISFDSTVLIREIPADEERKGPWETYAHDACRFRNKIEGLEKVLGRVLDAGHREKIYTQRFSHL